MFRLFWNKSKCSGCKVCSETCLRNCIRQRVDGTMVGGGLSCSGCGFCVDGCQRGALRLVWDKDAAPATLLPAEEDYYPEIPDFLRELIDLGRPGKVRAVMFDAICLFPPEDVVRGAVKRVVFRDAAEKSRPMLYATSDLEEARPARPQRRGSKVPETLPSAVRQRVPGNGHHGFGGASRPTATEGLDCSSCAQCSVKKDSGGDEITCLIAHGSTEKTRGASMENCPLIHARCPFLRRESDSA